MNINILIISILAGLAVYSKITERIILFRIAKPLATFSIIILALLNINADNSGYVLILILGFIFSLAGDILLMYPGKNNFISGLVSFLIAHLFFGYAFYHFSNSINLILIAPFSAFGFAALAYLQKDLGHYRIPVFIYVAAISFMSSAGWNLFISGGGYNPAPAAFGSALFLISDFILAVNKFKTKIKFAEPIILGTYYSALTLFALSAV